MKTYELKEPGVYYSAMSGHVLVVSGTFPFLKEELIYNTHTGAVHNATQFYDYEKVSPDVPTEQSFANITEINKPGLYLATSETEPIDKYFVFITNKSPFLKVQPFLWDTVGECLVIKEVLATSWKTFKYTKPKL